MVVVDTAEEEVPSDIAHFAGSHFVGPELELAVHNSYLPPHHAVVDCMPYFPNPPTNLIWIISPKLMWMWMWMKMNCVSGDVGLINVYLLKNAERVRAFGLGIGC